MAVDAAKGAAALDDVQKARKVTTGMRGYPE